MLSATLLPTVTAQFLDDDILADAEVAKMIESNSGVVEKEMEISNVNRSVGGRIAGSIAAVHGDYGFKGELKLNFKGAAGQSFGVFNTKGVHLRVSGECNDYVGKGMNGGSIVCLPPDGSTFESADNVIAGNTCLYGATGGEIFLNGIVGERFGVRNAGCNAVIEGAGDHLGEYMTNGVIVALGRIGRNVAAGLSGGLLYIYDPEEQGVQMNDDNKRHLFRVTSAAGEQQLRDLIQKHHDLTGSRRAATILEDWSAALGSFWQVAPPSMQQSELVAVAEQASVPAPARSVAVSAQSNTEPKDLSSLLMGSKKKTSGWGETASNSGRSS